MGWKSFSPLISFNSPSVIINNSPFNLFVEFQFFILLFLCTYHAFTRTNKFYRICWYASIFGGMAVETFSILNDNIDNYWYSQYLIMLYNKREPAFIQFGAYIWFTYTLNILVWHLNCKSMIAEYSFTAILTYFLWQSFDLIGIHFQFWTWHNSEPLYIDRSGGVPIASTFWAIAYFSGIQCSIRLMKNFYLKYRKNRNRISNVQCIILGIVASLGGNLMMQVPFLAIYHPLTTYLGWNTAYSLDAYIGVCVLIVGNHLRCNLKYLSITVASDVYFVCILQVLCIYGGLSALLMLIVNYGNDGYLQNMKQMTFHQPLLLLPSVFVTEDKLIENSFWGMFQRNRYVIRDEIVIVRDHYGFNCTEVSEFIADIESLSMLKSMNGTSVDWYPLCITGLESKWLLKYYWMIFIGCAIAFLSQIIQFSFREKIKSH